MGTRNTRNRLVQKRKKKIVISLLKSVKNDQNLNGIFFSSLKKTV